MGLYSIISRADGTVLTGQFDSNSNIFNVDHQNHVNHTEPMSINSFEADVAQMNVEVNPVPAGVVSLPSALADEIARLRFTCTDIKRLISAGTPPAHWYTAIGTFNTSVALPPVACRREQTAGIAINDNLAVTYPWNTTAYDTSSMASLSGITAPVTGTYFIGGTVSFSSVLLHNDFQLTLLRSGTASATNQVFSGVAAATKAITVETVARFTAGQILTLQVFQDNTNNPITGFRTTDPGAALWMALVGR